MFKTDFYLKNLRSSSTNMMWEAQTTATGFLLEENSYFYFAKSRDSSLGNKLVNSLLQIRIRGGGS